MNRYGNKAGIRYTKSNQILHIVLGRWELLFGHRFAILRNSKTCTSRWLGEGK